jgi:hypothetical protein
MTALLAEEGLRVLAPHLTMRKVATTEVHQLNKAVASIPATL